MKHKIANRSHNLLQTNLEAEYNPFIQTMKNLYSKQTQHQSRRSIPGSWVCQESEQEACLQSEWKQNEPGLSPRHGSSTSAASRSKPRRRRKPQLRRRAAAHGRAWPCRRGNLRKESRRRPLLITDHGFKWCTAGQHTAWEMWMACEDHKWIIRNLCCVVPSGIVSPFWGSFLPLVEIKLHFEGRPWGPSQLYIRARKMTCPILYQVRSGQVSLGETI